MQYCRNGSTFTRVWVDEGFNMCFLNTITSGILFLVLFIFGCVQCSMYRSYATNLEKKYVRTNFGSVLQIFLTVILVLESGARIMTLDLLKENGGVAGSDLLTFLCLFTSWLGTLKLISLERKSMLPTIPTRGHGLLLIVFWTLAFVRENLAFLSWWSHSWWWYLERYNNDYFFF